MSGILRCPVCNSVNPVVIYEPCAICGRYSNDPPKPVTREDGGWGSLTPAEASRMEKDE